MSDSDPVQQQQQQVLVYPNGVNVQPQSQTLPSSHSKGSFDASFIVLAVIIVVSAAACLLSRLCNKREHKKHKELKQDKNHKQRNGQGPFPPFPLQQSRRKDMEFGFGARVGPSPGFHQQQGNRTLQTKGSDIEMGFERRYPNGKSAPLPPNADMMRVQRPNHPNGVINGEAIPHFNGGR